MTHITHIIKLQICNKNIINYLIIVIIIIILTNKDVN